jgi:hypothetical protein
LNKSGKDIKSTQATRREKKGKNDKEFIFRVFMTIFQAQNLLIGARKASYQIEKHHAEVNKP